MYVRSETSTRVLNSSNIFIFSVVVISVVGGGVIVTPIQARV